MMQFRIILHDLDQVFLKICAAKSLSTSYCKITKALIRGLCKLLIKIADVYILDLFTGGFFLTSGDFLSKGKRR